MQQQNAVRAREIAYGDSYLGQECAGGLALVLGQPVLVLVGSGTARRLGTGAGRALMDHA